MFAVRGIAVSLSIFVLIYSALSLAVCCAWRRVWVWGSQYSAKNCADLLFVLRVAPLVSATGVTLVLAVPSFLLLEPHAVNESMGGGSLLLGFCGIAVLVAAMWNAASSLMRASRSVAGWSTGTTAIGSAAVDSKKWVAVLRSSEAAPPLITDGIRRPRVWLSRAAEFVLTERELQSALRHEGAHVRRRDNLKKLMLRLVAFPGMAELDSAWRETTEMAADDAAVSSISEALDLAAAVIKLSRLASLQPATELAAALVHSPAGSVNTRVERLIAWKEPRQVSGGSTLRYAWYAVATAGCALVVTYSTLLVRMHAATEWLVR
jgi:beta-lactamase regulating signal transducer with metallopeptidase domain